MFLVVTANTSGSGYSTSAPTLGGSPVIGAVKLAEGLDPSGGISAASIWMLPNCPGGSSSVAVTVTGGTPNAYCGLAAYEARAQCSGSRSGRSGRSSRFCGAGSSLVPGCLPQPLPGTCLPAAGYPGPVHSAAMAAARGRIGSSFGAPVVNPHRRPLAYAPQGPARARLLQLQPRAGWIASNPGAPVRNPVIPAFYPRPAVRAQAPMPRRGTCRAIRSYPPSSRRG